LFVVVRVVIVARIIRLRRLEGVVVGRVKIVRLETVISRSASRHGELHP
jgi:hypothetical protein